MTAGETASAGAGPDAPVVPPATGENQAPQTPFTTSQLLRLDRALRAAEQSTGLIFSIYLGPLDQPVRGHAEKLHGQLADADRAVLVAVSPNQRILEIITGGQARRQLPDRSCKLAALSMAAAFAGGDIAGGLLSGLSQLAEHAGRAAR